MTGIGVVGEEGLKESGTETLCQLRQLEIAMGTETLCQLRQLEIAMGVSLNLCSVKDILVQMCTISVMFSSVPTQYPNLLIAVFNILL